MDDIKLDLQIATANANRNVLAAHGLTESAGRLPSPDSPTWPDSTTSRPTVEELGEGACTRTSGVVGRAEDDAHALSFVERLQVGFAYSFGVLRLGADGPRTSTSGGGQDAGASHLNFGGSGTGTMRQERATGDRMHLD